MTFDFRPFRCFCLSFPHPAQFLLEYLSVGIFNFANTVKVKVTDRVGYQ